jgi:Tol biopolymer transport system component
MSGKFTPVSLAFFIFFSLSIPEVSAQSPQKIIRSANQLIDVDLYEDAIKELEPLVKKKYPEAILLTGYSLMAIEEKLPRAIEVLEEAVSLYPLKKKNSAQAIDAHFNLGQAYRLNGQPAKAYNEFIKLKKYAKKDRILAADIKQELQFCSNMQKLIKTPVEMKIEHLSDIINSQYEDHSPIVLFDESTIYFTSTRPIDTLKENQTLFENIFVTHWRNKKWTEPKILEIPGYHEANRATIGLTPDGQGLIFFENDGYNGALYITHRTFDGWSAPKPLPAPINSGYHETHASISPDGNTIYFSSERPGGFGGKDIYYSHKLPDETWGKPINAGKNINTPFDEDGPFIHPDNTTLYFSSLGHNSMGGYDIFKSKKAGEDEWTKAENIGYPINTPTDDLFYLPTPNGQRVYYASRQAGSKGLTDLFLLHFPASDDRSLAVVSSLVFDSENQPAASAIITVKNISKNKEVGIYRVNPQTGKFIAIVPTASQYELTIKDEGYSPFRQTFNIDLKDDYISKNSAIYLPPIMLTKKEDPH